MNGTVLGVSQSFAYLEDMQNRITGFVEKHSRIKPGRFRDLMLNTAEMTMDMGTVLDGENAVKEGLIDRLGGLSDAIDTLYELIETTPPRYI
jgi:ATP-dependent protease ClpP protease subunit